MNVRQLIEALERFPDYWQVQISMETEDERGRLHKDHVYAREVLDRQVSRTGAHGPVVPVVVIR